MKNQRMVAFGIIGVIAVIGYLIFFSSAGIEDEDLYPPPEPVAAPAPPELYLPQGVDQILDGMDFGNIAFNVPETLNIDDISRIQLILSLAEAVEELKQSITEEGRKVGEKVKIHNRMEADLTGSMFEIEAITPEIQAVSKTQQTEWKWEVIPQEEGTHSLYLTLNALLEVSGHSTPRVVRYFEEEIVVNVTASQKMESFVADNWQWLWSVILVPIAGWLWSRKKRKS